MTHTSLHLRQTFRNGIKTVALLVTLAACSYTVSLAQPDTTKVSFISYWSKGDSYDFRITKIRKQWQAENLSKNDSSSYLVNFLVLDSTEVSYKIKWSYETNLDEFNIPVELIDRFSKYKMTEVIYHTNELGEFMGIENWQEISEMMNGLFSDLVDYIAETQNSSRDAVAQNMQPLRSLYNSKEGVEQLVFKEIQLFHFPLGFELSTSEPLLYEEKLPNMLGGPPIRGDAKIHFEDIDFANSFCVLLQEMTLNPEDTKAMITSLFERMNLADDEMEEAIAAAKLDIRDQNRYAYFYYPGIPYRIETNREYVIDIASENTRRVDIALVTMVDA